MTDKTARMGTGSLDGEEGGIRAPGQGLQKEGRGRRAGIPSFLGFTCYLSRQTLSVTLCKLSSHPVTMRLSLLADNRNRSHQNRQQPLQPLNSAARLQSCQALAIANFCSKKVAHGTEEAIVGSCWTVRQGLGSSFEKEGREQIAAASSVLTKEQVSAQNEDGQAQSLYFSVTRSQLSNACTMHCHSLTRSLAYSVSIIDTRRPDACGLSVRASVGMC